MYVCVYIHIHIYIYIYIYIYAYTLHTQQQRAVQDVTLTTSRPASSSKVTRPTGYYFDNRVLIGLTVTRPNRISNGIDFE